MAYRPSPIAYLLWSMNMHLVVCLKQAPDHEGPRESYQINSESNRVEPSGIPPVISLFDENALEAALRIKDARDDVKITLVSVGKRISNAVMLRALAAGADELIKIEDDRFESHRLDTREAAGVIAHAVKKIGDCNLILVGRQSSDWNNGVMGIVLGKILNIPCITFAQKMEIDFGALVVTRAVENGIEIVRSTLPAVVMVTNEMGALRYPAMKERREAKNKPIHSWPGTEIPETMAPGGKPALRRLYAPELKTTDCRFVDGETPAQAGINLAGQLFEDKILPLGG
jgi:electron transfer flavoprotein beta subunit